MTTRPHGTNDRYRVGPDINDQPGKGCRCPKCRAAHTRVIKACRLRIAQGRSHFIDAEPTRQHVLKLREAGLSFAAIAALAGVARRTVRELVTGQPLQARPPSRRVRRETAAAILAVRPGQMADTATVLTVGTQRRLQALAWAGWPSTHIATRAGLSFYHVRRLTRGSVGPTVCADTARRVAEVFAELWNADPVKHGVRPVRAAQLRTIAARNGYAPFAAWDDIDDPADKPRGIRQVAA